MTTEQMDAVDAMIAAGDIDTAPGATVPAPAEPEPIKRDKDGRPSRATGRPPGRPRKDRAPAAERGPGRPSKETKRAEKLTAMLGQVGVGVFIINQRDGEIFLAGVPRLAEALAKLADQNPSIAKVIDSTVKVGAWADVALACSAIALPIMANHGMLPEGAALLVAPSAGDAPAEPEAPADAA